MMSKQKQVIAFFKEYSVQYYCLDSSTIIFPCVHCKAEAWMNVVNTHWSCSKCKASGTLMHLIQWSKHYVNSASFQIYNPKEEWYQIRTYFLRLLDKVDEPLKTQLKRLLDKNEKLYKYLIKMKSISTS